MAGCIYGRTKICKDKIKVWKKLKVRKINKEIKELEGEDISEIGTDTDSGKKEERERAHSPSTQSWDHRLLGWGLHSCHLSILCVCWLWVCITAKSKRQHRN